MKKKLHSPPNEGTLTKQKKIILWIMKKSLFLFIIFFNITSFGYTQTLSLNLGNTTIREAFENIEKESNLTLFYSDDELDLNKLVRVKFKNKSALEIISEIVGAKFEVKMGDRSVVMIVPVSAAPVSAVEQPINGKVVGELGENLPKASIKIKGTTKSAVADFEGNFTISANIGDVLVVSYVGYASKEITITGSEKITIKLRPEENKLSDVVIIGYQKAHKKNVNASTSSINSKQLESIPVLSVSSIIASLATGIQTPNISGAPASRSNFLVRGNTSLGAAKDVGSAYSNPLYVIDGVQTTLEDLAGFNATNVDFLASLNPNDIASIDLLKDASAAAIYGSRGANGVIIITTKKGGALNKPEFNFSTSVGFTPIPKLIPILVGAAERNAKWNMINRWWKTHNQQDQYVPMVLSDSLNPAFNNNIDYQGLFYKTGYDRQYNLSMRGGTENSNYRISLGHNNIEGIVQNTGFKRYTLATNVNSKIGKYFENQAIVNFLYTDNKTGQGNPDGAFYQFNSTLPADPAFLNSSLFFLSENQKKSLKGSLNDKLNTDETIQLTLSNYSKINFTDALSFNSQFNFVYSSQKKNFYSPSSIRPTGDGLASYSLYTRKNLSSDIYVNYYKTIKNHTVSAVAGTKVDYNKYEDMFINASGFGPDAVKVINDRYTKDQIGGATSISSNALVSYFGRLSYNFKERYMIDGTYSTDGSSRFGKDNRWAKFSSVALGWIFSEESFIKNKLSNIISYGKFRASYGINGSQFDGDFLRFGTYSLGYSGNVLYSNTMSTTTYGGVTGTIPNFGTIGNSKLSWETSRQWDLGFDLDLFHNRLNITFDAYHKLTDKLFDVSFPNYSGFFGAPINDIVGVLNYGWESMVKYQVFPRTNDLKLELSFGLSQNENYITKLPNGNRDFYGVDSYGREFGYVIGKPLNLSRLLINDYILDNFNQLSTNPYTGEALHGKGAWAPINLGFPIWKDLNGDYLLREEEDYKLSYDFKPTPDVTGLFNLDLRYKGWYLQAYSQFSFGSSVLNTVTPAYLDEYDRSDSNWANRGLIDLSSLQFWQQPGDGAAGVRFPAIYPTAPGLPSYYRFRTPQTLWIESGDYWKITNASFGYTFEKGSIIDKLNLTRLRIYTAVLNPYQWQRSKLLPDASQVDATGHNFGNGYPAARTFTFGLDIKF